MLKFLERISTELFASVVVKLILIAALFALLKFMAPFEIFGTKAAVLLVIGILIWFIEFQCDLISGFIAWRVFKSKGQKLAD